MAGSLASVRNAVNSLARFQRQSLLLDRSTRRFNKLSGLQEHARFHNTWRQPDTDSIGQSKIPDRGSLPHALQKQQLCFFSTSTYSKALGLPSNSQPPSRQTPSGPRLPTSDETTDDIQAPEQPIRRLTYFVKPAPLYSRDPLSESIRRRQEAKLSRLRQRTLARDAPSGADMSKSRLASFFMMKKSIPESLRGLNTAANVILIGFAFAAFLYLESKLIRFCDAVDLMWRKDMTFKEAWRAARDRDAAAVRKKIKSLIPDDGPRSDANEEDVDLGDLKEIGINDK